MTPIDPIALAAVTGGTRSSTGAGTLLQRPTISQPHVDSLTKPSVTPKPSFQPPPGPLTPLAPHSREV